MRNFCHFGKFCTPTINFTSLQDVFKMSWRRFCKTSWRRLENVLKTSWRRLENVLKTSWRRMTKTNILVLIKTSSSRRMFAGSWRDRSWMWFSSENWIIGKTQFKLNNFAGNVGEAERVDWAKNQFPPSCQK